MSKITVLPHTNLDTLAKLKIPALDGRGAKNNKLIIENIAQNGPLLKYDVFKNLKPKIKSYDVAWRRIDSLKEQGYLAEAGKRATKRGKRTEETIYGLTWKGFIASLSIEKVRDNILEVLEKNPLLSFPEKQFVLLVIKEIFTKEELSAIVTPIFQAYLNTIPNLEDLKEADLFLWLSALRDIPPIQQKIASKIDLTKLLDNRTIFTIIKDRFLPMIANYERSFREMHQLFRKLNEIAEFIYTIEDEEKPSEKLKEYFKSRNF